jgi:uncharacterized phage protein gp47/JayE
MTTLTDLVFIDSTGYHYSDYPSFLAWLQDQYKAIYGADIYIEADSQDGQFLAILAQAFYDTAALGASVYNSFSPVTAQGIGLSRDVKINGISRRAPTFSTVDLVIVGTTGTTITNGIAQDTLQQKWLIPSPTVIPSGGTITVTATAQDVGAIQAAANSITTIFTPTLGWQTVNNPAEATPGVAVETDAELRIRQAQSTANPSLTVLEGTVGGVANVAGVTNVRGYENDTGSTDGNGLPAHSISLVVYGGATIDVAQEIQLHKTPGTQTYGTTSQIVNDSHGMPLNIHFYRPTLVTITCTVTIAATTSYSSDYTALIKQAIADQINSFDIGNTVLITKLYAPAYLNGAVAGTTYSVVSLTIGKNVAPQSNVNIPIAFNELPVCVADVNVTVVVT